MLFFICYLCNRLLMAAFCYQLKTINNPLAELDVFVYYFKR